MAREQFFFTTDWKSPLDYRRRTSNRIGIPSPLGDISLSTVTNYFLFNSLKTVVIVSLRIVLDLIVRSLSRRTFDCAIHVIFCCCRVFYIRESSPTWPPLEIIYNVRHICVRIHVYWKIISGLFIVFRRRSSFVNVEIFDNFSISQW